MNKNHTQNPNDEATHDILSVIKISMEAIIETGGDLDEAARILDVGVDELKVFLENNANLFLSWPKQMINQKLSPVSVALLMWQRVSGIYDGFSLLERHIENTWKN